MPDHVETARRYLEAIGAGAVGDDLAAFFDPEIVQEEFPNRLVPEGATRTLDEILQSAERGTEVLSGQTYEVTNVVAAGDTVALEVIWRGTLAVPIGMLTAGDAMRARFAVFLEFRDGRILRQRNYDCFDPF